MSNFFEELPAEILDASFDIGILMMIFAGCLTLFMIFCFFLLNAFIDKIERKADIKRYLQTHCFDRFRVEPFTKNEYVIAEYICADCPPYDVLHCKNFINADKICQILNCDFFGEQYTEKKELKFSNLDFKRISKELSNRNCAEDINNFKDPQKEGERK